MYMGGFAENIIEFHRIKRFNCLFIEDAPCF